MKLTCFIDSVIDVQFIYNSIVTKNRILIISYYVPIVHTSFAIFFFFLFKLLISQDIFNIPQNPQIDQLYYFVIINFS